MQPIRGGPGSVEGPAEAHREGPADQGRTEVVEIRPAGVTEGVVGLLQLIGQIDRVEADREPIVDVEAGLEVEALLRPSPDADRIGEDSGLVVVQEILAPDEDRRAPKPPRS